MEDYLAQIEALLAEPVAEAAEREIGTFTASLRGTNGGVVLFGAGRLGKLCARALPKAGVPLRAFCDRNAALRGSFVEGVEVLEPEEAARRFGGDTLFVVAIWTGTARESMVERLTWLRGLGCAHVATYVPLMWAWGRDEVPFHAFDLPTRLLQEAGEIRRLGGLLGDDRSRKVLLAALRQRLLGRFDGEAPAVDQYFPADLVRLSDHEVFIDGGAFDGDTLEQFLRRTHGRFEAFHAFEPDEMNVAKLREKVATLPPAIGRRIVVHQLALHSERAELEFTAQGAQTSQITKGGKERAQADRADEVIGDQNVTFLKLDVEGAERAALRGAEGLLKSRRPRVAVCVYHRPDDLWTIPLAVYAALPEQKLFLRQHGFDGWETVCYSLGREDAASSR